MLLFAAWKPQQDSARYRSLYVTTWIRAAAEGGKKFCTSIPTSSLLFCSTTFASLPVSSYTYIRFCLCLIIILVVFIEGIHGGVSLSAELFGRFAAGSCLIFFSLISVRQIVLPYSNYHKSCLISSHKRGAVLSSCGGNSRCPWWKQR